MAFAKPIIASIAAAIAMAGVTATPARANDSDIVGFLAGATVLAIIANAVNDHHNHNRHRVVVQRRYVYTPPRRVTVYTPPRRVIVTRPWNGDYRYTHRRDGYRGHRRHGYNRWADNGYHGRHHHRVHPWSQNRVDHRRK